MEFRRQPGYSIAALATPTTQSRKARNAFDLQVDKIYPGSEGVLLVV